MLYPMFDLFRNELQEITTDVRHLKQGVERHKSEIATYHLQR